MKKILALVVLGVLAAAPLFAVEGSSASKGTLSVIEFSRLPENHGAPARVLQRQYEEYRSGRLPVTTLDTSRMR